MSLHNHFVPISAATLPNGLALRQFTVEDAEVLFALIDRDRSHLRRWLPWVDLTLAPNNARNFIVMSLEQARNHNGFQCAIVDGERILGTIGLHSVDWPNRKTSLGYWLSSAATGRGAMTAAVRYVVSHCFDVLKLHRVEIRCAVHNSKSRAIPVRLGFIEEGVLRESEWLGDHFVDHVVYAMLAPAWRKII
jgi:ribosomal-protein-serine acetyltransferase